MERRHLRYCTPYAVDVERPARSGPRPAPAPGFVLDTGITFLGQRPTEPTVPVLWRPPTSSMSLPDFLDLRDNLPVHPFWQLHRSATTRAELYRAARDQDAAEEARRERLLRVTGHRTRTTVEWLTVYDHLIEQVRVSWVHLRAVRGTWDSHVDQQVRAWASRLDDIGTDADLRAHLGGA